LVLLDDPQFLEAYRALAGSVLKTETAQDARLTKVFRLATRRHPIAAEMAAMRDYHASQLQRYASDREAAVQLLRVAVIINEGVCMAQLIIGLGTGRCGTKSLTGLLNAQPGAAVTHEIYGPEVKWSGSEDNAHAVVDPEMFLRRATRMQDERGIFTTDPSELRLYGDVSINWLPYLDVFEQAGAKFVVMQRPYSPWARSFLSHMGDNRWFWPEPSDPPAAWDESLPHYDDDPTPEEAALRYYVEYYEACAAFADDFPERVLWLDIEDLNDVDRQRELLTFVGVPEADIRLFPGGIDLKWVKHLKAFNATKVA
jgi:hypothetical protein